MDTNPRQAVDEFVASEDWFVSFFIRVLLVSVVLTVMLLTVGIALMRNT